MTERSFLAQTFDRMLREQYPNLFRLYLNPHVVQACLCLERYVQTAWSVQSPYQTFLANSFDEAVSGAVKLARYCAHVAGKPSQGLVIDADNRLGPFAATTTKRGIVEFIPGLTVVRKLDDLAVPLPEFGFVVVMAGTPLADAVAELIRTHRPLVITCVDRENLRLVQPAVAADIVVFDESFVRREVPFGAFTARKALYDHWNTSAKSTFHSTTFQPNTIASLHFLRCVEADDAEFYATVADDLRLIETDVGLRMSLLRSLYSPAIANAIKATGFATADIRATGDHIIVNGRAVFDGVGGVACSVRGHNPPTYTEEIEALADVDAERELTERLQRLTGLAHMLPAVSGAGAVECALKLGLAAQYPRRHVLALKSGFGGKTLFALTGTWNSSYKQHIDPLYPHVLYVDPFAPDAIAQIDAALTKHDVAVVQAELIQGVGGVRRVPEIVIRHLAAKREQHDYLLLLDEVQTGVYRTGPFTVSSAMDLRPDLLVVGKAISDMMFPFALTMFADSVQTKLADAGADLPAFFRARHGFAYGYKTALNVLRFAERANLSERVTQSGTLFERLLRQELAGCTAVRDVRVYGLLIGIELDDARWPQSWFKKRLFWFYLSAMLKHAEYPALVGFCQYEPNVLKITPPLTVDAAEIRKLCATIGEVLRRPFYQLLASAFGGLLHSYAPWSKKHDHAKQSAHEPVSR